MADKNQMLDCISDQLKCMHGDGEHAQNLIDEWKKKDVGVIFSCYLKITGLEDIINNPHGRPELDRKEGVAA